VLSSENAELYRAQFDEIARCIDPNDAIEWLWVRDIADLDWEIRRLRRFKIGYVEDEFPNYSQLGMYERADHLIASAEIRRNTVLREIEIRREILAERRRLHEATTAIDAGATRLAVEHRS
jgi:hypothetical protein